MRYVQQVVSYQLMIRFHVIVEKNSTMIRTFGPRQKWYLFRFGVITLADPDPNETPFLLDRVGMYVRPLRNFLLMGYINAFAISIKNEPMI